MLRLLQAEIGSWSRSNFGEQVSKLTNQSLGEVAPLLGILEELSELESAETREEGVDAFGDIGIYLLDFCDRSGLLLYDVVTLTPCSLDEDSYEATYKSLGQIHHCVLKSHQGIRLFKDPQYRLERLTVAVKNFWDSLIDLADEEYDLDLLSCIEKAWETVKLRNWKKDEANGQV